MKKRVFTLLLVAPSLVLLMTLGNARAEGTPVGCSDCYGEETSSSMNAVQQNDGDKKCMNGTQNCGPKKICAASTSPNDICHATYCKFGCSVSGGGATE